MEDKIKSFPLSPAKEVPPVDIDTSIPQEPSNTHVPSTKLVVDNFVQNVQSPTAGDIANITAGGGIEDSGKKTSDFIEKVQDATDGNLAALDANGNVTDSGKKASDFLEVTPSATENDFVSFDANGNIKDSGKSASDFVEKVQSPTAGNFAGIDAQGNMTDSGKKASDFVEKFSADQEDWHARVYAANPDGSTRNFRVYQDNSDGNTDWANSIVQRRSDGRAACADPQVDADVVTLGYLKNTMTAHHYTVRWDKVQAQMVRLNDASDITTNTENFVHKGSINTDYSNPFDSIYPWSGRKLCNIDMNAYMNLSIGDSLIQCVKSWEGDVDFSYDDVNGVWVYTPEFWGKTWDDGTYRYFDVADKAYYEYVHYPERIEGRWHGRAETVTIGGSSKTCLLPAVGMPAKSIAISTLHTYANNWGATLDTIFSVDANILLMVVEFASMNSQNAIGSGVSNMFRQSNDRIQASSTGAVVKVLKENASAYCIPGAIFDIGTSNGGIQVGSYQIVSVETDSQDNTILNVTLNAEVTVTTANYWSVHGLCNMADSEIGSKSGYIGTNGKSIAYYRGMEMWGNMYFYILGAYRQTGTQHVFIAHDDEEADGADALNASLHIDTGITLSSQSAFIKNLGILSRSDLLSIPPFCTGVAGNSENPVGDYFFTNANAGNTVLILGGLSSDGSYAGAFYGTWVNTASNSDWNCAARPRLKPWRN